MAGTDTKSERSIRKRYYWQCFKSKGYFLPCLPVYGNQPFLTALEEFILTDIGSHLLDVCRFLFGEATWLYCQTASVNPPIKGEYVANVFMKMRSGLHCYAEMNYAPILENEVFPQTLVLVEGEKGSVRLTTNFDVKVTTSIAVALPGPGHNFYTIWYTT